MDNDPLVQTVSKPEFKLREEYVPYPAQLNRIEPHDEGQFGPQFKWIFILDEDKGRKDDGSDFETWAFTSNKITSHEKNKARQFYKGITGEDPAVDQVVDLRLLFGKRCQVLFEHKETKDGKRDRVFALKPARPEVL